MAESALSISYSDLLVEIGVFLGYSPDTTARSPVQTAEVDRYVQAGVRQFYYPPAVQGVEAGYTWSFLSPNASIATTVDIGEQDLPDGLGRILGDLFYRDEEHKRSVIQVSEDRIKSCLQHSTDTGTPTFATIRFKEQVDGEGQKLEIVWYPIPDNTYTLYYKYEAHNGKLTDANPYPLGGMRLSELVLASCLSVAEKRANDESGIHTADFHRLLAAGVALDRKQGAKSYGQMGASSQNSVAWRRDNGYVTYKGVTW